MTIKRFNKTLTLYDGQRQQQQEDQTNQLPCNGQPETDRAEGGRHAHHQCNGSSSTRAPRFMAPLDNELSMDYTSGVSGIFAPIKNDFSVFVVDSANGRSSYGCTQDCAKDRYRDEPEWPVETRERVKRVRFVICTLALLGLAMGLMSRLMLNVSIVEMVRKPDLVPHEDLQPETITPLQGLVTTVSSTSSDELLDVARDDLFAREKLDSVGQDFDKLTMTTSQRTDTTVDKAEGQTDTEGESGRMSKSVPGDSLHFDWSKQEINVILGSFYVGYAPAILFSGSLAERYGAKYPLFVCIFGSGVINVLTPIIASYSVNLLIGSRIMLGIVQGSLLPSLYELFNRWLTQTESSIFAPMIKVSMPMGSLIGTLMPGVLASFKLEWPNLFYVGGFLCFAWSFAWILLATSLPQTNRMVEPGELNRIMRKKKSQLDQLSQLDTNSRISSQKQADNGLRKDPPTKRNDTPWFLIVTSPSVLALTVVKFTYNIGMEFVFLQLAVYLREVHSAPIETISVIASSGYCMQMLLITFVGWLAKIVIIKRACGLSVTKWRKVFQGSSNFIMAFTYVVLAYLKPDLEIATVLLMSVCFWWMMGAGGESMLPYDLSSKYPASIVSFAHSISIFSGVVMTALCDVILGEHTEDPDRWSTLFYTIAGLLSAGGLVFVLFVKAKPFLPGEKR